MTALLLALQLTVPAWWPAANPCGQPAAVERVVDADTVILRVELWFDVIARVRIRLAGIDTPERFTPEGKRAAADLDALLRAARVTVIPTGGRSFERHVGHVFVACTNVADWLRSAGHEKRR